MNKCQQLNKWHAFYTFLFSSLFTKPNFRNKVVKNLTPSVIKCRLVMRVFSGLSFLFGKVYCHSVWTLFNLKKKKRVSVSACFPHPCSHSFKDKLSICHLCKRVENVSSCFQLCTSKYNIRSFLSDWITRRKDTFDELCRTIWVSRSQK